MRMWSAVCVATAMVAGAASAQMKVPKQPQRPVGQQQPAVSASASPLVLTTQPSLESAKRIPRDEAIKMVKENKAVWVDVRPVDQFNEGHIKGAINIPESDIVSRVKELPKGKYIITYCA